MPFEIRKQDGKFCVFTQDTDHNHGCHDTEEEAKKHLAAMYANVPDARKADADYVIAFGSAVKAMGDGRVGGYLIQWGGPTTADAEGEWFTPETDFDTDFPARTSVRYNHGMDPTIGRRRLGYGSMKTDDTGVWVEYQLDLAERHQAAIYGLARAGKLGWSSGAVAHMTDPPRERAGGAIKSWPGIIHDASLTPMPADPRNLAVALKSWDPPSLEDLASERGSDVKSPSLAEVTERWIESGETLLGDYRTHAMKAGRKLSAARRERLAQMHQLLGEMLAETDPDPTAASRDGEQPTEEAGASSDAGDLEAQFMAINARLNGVPVPLGAPHANPGGTTQ